MQRWSGNKFGAVRSHNSSSLLAINEWMVFFVKTLRTAWWELNEVHIVFEGQRVNVGLHLLMALCLPFVSCYYFGWFEACLVAQCVVLEEDCVVWALHDQRTGKQRLVSPLSNSKGRRHFSKEAKKWGHHIKISVVKLIGQQRHLSPLRCLLTPRSLRCLPHHTHSDFHNPNSICILEMIIFSTHAWIRTATTREHLWSNVARRRY
jgi:hypothetical protein